MREERAGKKRIQNNQGFSLIELLVAVIILAVIFVPLMHSFVTATRTNSRAKKTMEATTAGQNVFEELKSSTVTDFFSGTTGNQQVDTGVVDSEGQTVYALSGELDRSVNGNSYHMKVTLDPQDYVTASGDPAKDTDYNSAGWSDLSSLAKSDNAFLIMGADDAENAVNEIALMAPGEDLDNIRAGLNRRIDITISHSDATKVSIVKASVTYTYNTYSYLATDAQEIYNNGTELENVLSNLFICYYPMYNNSGRMSPTESITVDNSGNYPIGVYLIRQTSSPNALEESRYSVALNVVEGTRDLNAVDAKPVTTLATNLAYEEGNSASNELQLSYSGNTVSPGKKLTDILDISEKNSGGLAREKSAIRIYKVTIEIYGKKVGGADELLTTMEGTKIE